MAKVGVSDFHYALLTKDDLTGVTYGEIKAIPKLVEVSVKASSQTDTLYADNGPAEVASALGEITVDITLADLPLEDQAALLGHTVANGVMVSKASDTAPDVAIGFVVTKSNGKKQYVWLLKGQFQLPEESYKTKGERIEFQTQKITGKFVKRVYDDAWRKITDEDAQDYQATTGQNWFAVTTINAGA